MMMVVHDFHISRRPLLRQRLSQELLNLLPHLRRRPTCSGTGLPRPRPRTTTLHLKFLQPTPPPLPPRHLSRITVIRDVVSDLARGVLVPMPDSGVLPLESDVTPVADGWQDGFAEVAVEVAFATVDVAVAVADPGGGGGVVHG